MERNNVDSQQSCTYTLGFLLMFPKYLEKEMLMFQQKKEHFRKRLKKNPDKTVRKKLEKRTEGQI